MPRPGEVPREGEQERAALRVVVEDRASARIVTVAGELDHDSAEVLRAALARPMLDGVRRIVIDLGELRFCDSTGLNILLRARIGAEAVGRTLEVARPRPVVARLFEVTGTEALLRVRPDPEAALEGPEDPADPAPADPE